MNLIFAVAGQGPVGMSNMTTLTAFAPHAGRVRFWKAATGFFGLASAGVFADVALGSEGLGTAVFIAAIPAVFAALSALALRSVVSPLRAPKVRIHSMFPRLAQERSLTEMDGGLMSDTFEMDGHSLNSSSIEEGDEWADRHPTAFDPFFESGSGFETVDGFFRDPD